jgi:hypothetical protein
LRHHCAPSHAPPDTGGFRLALSTKLIRISFRGLRLTRRRIASVRAPQPDCVTGAVHAVTELDIFQLKF